MMISPTPTTTAAATGEATYTTIPISGSDVVSRSVQNLFTFLSRSRPWPEFLAAGGGGSLDLPSSSSSAAVRIRRNFKYFAINYAIVTSTCVALSLIVSPISLILVGFVYALWLVLHFFREDPMVVMGYHVNDWAVIAGLILASVVTLWVTGVLSNLLIGIAVGVLVSAIHGLLRNPEGLFLDENDAASNGLISTSKNGGIS
ncbi:hypothetical protein M9H77_14979 [Catharanthus roseus]|uniref:Uncharacterized protein n=1 Tax=Catharanthus roseus TaxID=4058 RepID=A0ACC0BPL3_CATRO|nr:hypothetical protein M9H77_14979 [Catharanthus roseus]